MRDYGRVFSAVWESADFRALTEDGRMLVLYLLTCQHGTLAGVFRLPDGYVAEDLQWSLERVSEGFSDVFRMGFAERCHASKWVWVCKYLEWNPLENPNQRKSAMKIAEKIPANCEWRQAFRRACGESIGLQPEPFLNPSPRVPEQGTGAVEGAGEGTGAVGSAAGNGSPPPPPPAQPAAEAAAKRGKRLPDDFALPKAWGEWAQAKYAHWTADTIRAIADKFRNHWVAKAGKDATKLDWFATWQNWCTSDITQRENPPPKGAADAGDAEARRLARVAAMHRVAAEAAGGAITHDPNVIDA